MTSELFSFSATDLVAGYRARDFTPTEVTAQVLDSIDALEPRLNAFYRIERDYAQAAAAASTKRWADSSPAGAIDGVPLTIKENVATVGSPLPAGTGAAYDNPPSLVDGPTASLTQAAGGVRLGKTVMPDYGMLSSGVSSLHGITHSPWNPDWTVGGSSGGAGACAAARLGPLHIGSDIGGSLRLPATWLGLATLKPSFGLVPVDPAYMGRSIGPLARTIDDIALYMGVLAAPDARDFTQVSTAGYEWTRIAAEPIDDAELAGLRIAVHVDAGCGLPTDPEVAAAVAAAAALFERAGATVETIPPFMTPELLAGLDLFLRSRSWLDVKRLTADRRALVLPFIVEWVMAAADSSGVDIIAAYQEIQRMRRVTVEATLPFDVVLSPAAPVLAFPAEWPMPSNDPRTSLHHIGYTAPYNFSEQPAVSVNCGFSENGRPIGLQIAGRRFADVELLRVAKWFESARGTAATPLWPL